MCGPHLGPELDKQDECKTFRQSEYWIYYDKKQNNKKKPSCLEIHAEIFSEINARMLKLHIFNFLQYRRGLG